MLVRLFGRNFRSLKEDFELSLVAADLKREEDRDRGVIDVPISGMEEPLRLLRALAIFGSNGSGKSTVLTAGRALRWLATASSSRATPNSGIPSYEPFLLDDMARQDPIQLGCDVVHKKTILRYEISYNRKSILTESMVSLDANGQTELIKRLPSGEVTGRLIDESAANRLYVKEMQPNVAVLSKLAQHGPHKGAESARPFYKSIRNALRYEDYSGAAALEPLGQSTDDRFADDADYRLWIMQHLMCTADVGICDVQTTREKLEIPDFIKEQVAKSELGIEFPEKKVVVSFVHHGASKQKIDFTDESSGTKKLFHIANDWWRLANEPATLLADELGASLHPRLFDRLIRAVNDTPAGRIRSQLIFTCHETGLLESLDGQPPALRRDQVYFTKKNLNGASELFSLAEFKEDARPVHNIRKRYLSGLYGAIPSVERLSL